MSSSDNGSPTAARMLMSVQRFEGGGLFATSTGGGGDGGAGVATAAVAGGCCCGRGRGAGFGAGAACAGFSGCTSAERHGVRHGLAWAAAGGAAPHSAITIAIGAMAENGEDRAW